MAIQNHLCIEKIVVINESAVRLVKARNAKEKMSKERELSAIADISR